MATRLDLTVDQGTSFTTTIELTDANDVAFDLSLYTGAGQFRKNSDSSSYAEFDISLDEDTGARTLTLTPHQPADLEPGRYVYDVELTDELNNIIRVIEGIVTLTPQVTRNV